MLGVTGGRADEDEARTVRSSPPETFPPRLTMTVTYTDRLTGASADRRGENPQPVGGKPRASVFLYYPSGEERKKASQIEKNGSVSWFLSKSAAR